MQRLLVLVRHGQSDWNLKDLFTGWKDPDLTKLGIEEARAAGRALKAKGFSFDRAYTSNLLRAQNSLTLILAELGQQNVPTVRNEALNERDYGDLSGLNKDEARAKWGKRQVHLWRRSYEVRPPGGESSERYGRPRAALLLRGDLAACAARRAYSRRGTRQFLAGPAHGPRSADAGDRARRGDRNRRCPRLSA